MEVTVANVKLQKCHRAALKGKWHVGVAAGGGGLNVCITGLAA